jgi:hypothetical protein
MGGSVWTGEPQRKRAETEGQMVKGNQIVVGCERVIAGLQLEQTHPTPWLRFYMSMFIKTIDSGPRVVTM